MKLLWIGDAGCDSGFARATHEILFTLRDSFDVSVIGINYRGDPHAYPYPIYPAYTMGCRDLLGYDRILEIVPKIEPDVVVVMNDPWNIPKYTDILKPYGAPIVGIVAVDGKNCAGHLLNDLSSAIFWTKFGLREAKLGGYTGSGCVVPLGVNLTVYKPMDRLEARQSQTLMLPEELHDAYIVGNVNRNQPRKRFDLTISYFCEWVKDHGVQDAYLFIHSAPTGEHGYDCSQLMRYYGVKKRLIQSIPNVWYGLSEAAMRDTYCSYDVMLSTTQGEGFGLPTLEGMACGIPQILPDWSALGEWATFAAHMVPCTTFAATVGKNNPIGGIMDRSLAIEALAYLYRAREYRKRLSKESIKLASDPKFRWSNIATQIGDELRRVISPKPEQVQAV